MNKSSLCVFPAEISFRIVAITAATICFALAMVWIMAPQYLLWFWQIGSPEPALLMSRRGGALFLGMATMLFLARNAEISAARTAIAAGMSTSCAVLAALGLYELIAGHAGAGLWMAITIEISLALGFATNYYQSQ